MANEYLNNKRFQALISKFQQSKKEKAKTSFIIEDIQGTILRKSKRCTNLDDIQNKLAKQQTQYSIICSEYEVTQLELVKCFYLLSEQIVNFARFNYIDNDDAVQEGVMICFEKIDRFDPNYVGKNGKKAKAFNYMTTCIFNHFKQLYRTQRNFQEFKKKFRDYIASQITRNALKSGKEVPINGCHDH